MRSGISVRVNDHVRDRNISDYVTGLKFRKVAPGGHHSASCTVTLPYRTFANLGPADRLYVYESRSGTVLWDGYTDNPGASAGVEGQSFDLSAMGGMARAADERRALVYVDGDLGQWTLPSSTAIPASATTSVGPDPNAVLADGLVMQFTPGSPIGTSAMVQLGYHLDGTDMTFGGIAFSYASGKVDSGYDIELSTSGGASPADTFVTAPSWNTSLRATVRTVGDVSSPPAGRTYIALRMRRTGGATNIADDTTWTLFNAVSLIGRRMDRYGTLLTGVAQLTSAAYVLTGWVAEDLVGRLLTFCDPVTATIATTPTAQIDQLTYPSGATAAEVLDDLTLHEPDYLWEILDSGTTGRHTFNYRAWPDPTDVRYEISTADGYNAPGGDNDLCNRITVNWTDATKDPPVPQVTVRTATVLTLSDAGITRDADPVTLPDGMGSAANAARIGDAVLATLATPPRAATAVVTHRILDRLTGRLIYPWSIGPGWNVRVRETGDVLRLTETEYDHDAGATTLTLGTPVQTTDQIVARLTRKV